jgi:hypothetical protein
MIELTQEQTEAQAAQKTALQVRDPKTQEIYVLICQDVYELTCRIIGGGKGKIWDDEADEGLIKKCS